MGDGIVDRAIRGLRRRVARPLLLQLRRPYVLGRIANPSETRLLGYRLRTHPDVFHPVWFASSQVLVEHLLARPLRGQRVLDMGTGAGPVAVAAASAGAVVTACDINPRAVALARENLELNGVKGEVLESDLFAALPGRRFDFICFNLPFYPREPKTLLEAAFNAGPNLDTVRRFAAGCAERLDAEGRVVVLFSEDCDVRAILRAFEAGGLATEDATTTRRLLEDFHVAWFRRAAPATA